MNVPMAYTGNFTRILIVKLQMIKVGAHIFRGNLFSGPIDLHEFYVNFAFFPLASLTCPRVQIEAKHVYMLDLFRMSK